MAYFPPDSFLVGTAILFVNIGETDHLSTISHSRIFETIQVHSFIGCSAVSF